MVPPRGSTLSVILAVVVVACSGAALPEAEVSAAAPGRPSGETLARLVCAGCHLFPGPELLDRATWRDQVLPRMETRLGVSPPDYSVSPEGELLRALGIYPAEPMIPREDWEAIVAYYLAAAPVAPLPQDPRPEIRIGLPLFEFEAPGFRVRPALTTLVHLGVETRRLFVGDEGGQRLLVFGDTLRAPRSIPLGNVPVALAESPGGLHVTAIGSFLPSEHQRGALLFLPEGENGFGAARTLIGGLPRAVHAEFADFNGDGRMDVALCLFGNHRGRFSWFENLGGDRHREHVLSERSGAIRSLARDFDGDGFPDLLVLTAQESETVQVLFNDGRGGFRFETILQFPPSHGLTHFELADFDGDGVDDLLLVNGDNGEFASPPKRYHGLRLYRGLGAGRFETEPAWFFPLNGATKAVARDFDEDGDLDIAAIAYFPDYERSPRESFVYLENRGGGNFVPATFAQCIAGRWLTLDAGDLDGDGDIDLVLGSYVRGPTPVPAFLQRTWDREGPPFVILRNTLRHPAPAPVLP
ncbi:MAG: VCBS repeat-containing protein [Verrucomicrobiae bacterium]|nr:VCBS repeat-containing protein [Verrucomicrobiae bacterium]